RRQGLEVGHVEHLPAKLELLVLAPGHIKGFAQSHIGVHIVWLAERIAWTAFAGIGVAEALVDGLEIAAGTAKQLWRTGTARAGVYSTSGCYVSLYVPVRRPARVVVGVTDGQSRIPTGDGGELPSSHQGVQATIGRVQEGSAFTERQLPNGRGIDEVPNVEVGAVVPIVLANGVDDKCRAIPAPRLQAG